MVHILATGRLGKEFSDAIKKIDNEFKGRYVDTPSPEDIDWADCLAAFSVPEEVNISGIKWIHSFGAGVESYISRKDLSARTILTKTTGNLGFKMGEFCLCHMLNYFQGTFKIYEHNRNRKWEPTSPQSLMDMTVLILGTGEMATGISNLLQPMRTTVIGVNSTGKVSDRSFSECIVFDSIKTTVDRVSCVINTLPLTKYTNGLLNARFFNLFEDILFINVGRGKSVVAGDLIPAIEKNNVAYAVLDVFEEEPLPGDSPLWTHPKIFISPHQSAVTDIRDIMDSFCQAYELMKSNKKNNLFVDFEKGY